VKYGGKDLEGWEFMRIRGIPLKVHQSWFLIFLLFTWTSAGQVANVIETPIPVWTRWIIGLITSLLLFISVLLHELGHSFVAIREGVKVRSITLFFLGGVAFVEKECSTAMGTFRVAIAGPLVSLSLAIFLSWSVQSANQINPLLANLLAQLGSLNFILAFFNLLPGLPLDGGIILKSLVWHFTGSQRKGILVANSIGHFLSIACILLGFIIVFSAKSIGGLWLIVMGWFGLSASRSQSHMLNLQKMLVEIKTSHASRRGFRVLEDSESLKKLSEISKIQKGDDYQPEWILICHQGRWLGYINDLVLKDVPVQNWDTSLLREYLSPLEELPSITCKEPLWKAVLILENSEAGRLLVLNEAHLPQGTIDRVDLGLTILRKIGLRLPDQFIQSARKKNVYPLGLSLPDIVNSMLASNIINLDKS
tara:strand:- start:3328 stop:4593 length:1266 start_codon:yes stop_codon:yes gene_type:complete